jgi:DNA mismatch repair protein MLH3
VIQLLQRLVYEFLKAHHYKPYPVANASGKTENDAPGSSHTSPVFSIKDTGSRSSTPNSTRNAESSSKHRARLMDLDNWSRVKAAKFDAKEIDGRCTISGPKKVSASDPTASLASSEGSPSPFDEIPSETINWTNYSSGKSYQVNKRTGNTATRIVPSVGIKRTASATLADRRISIPAKRSKSTASSSDAPQEPGDFVQNLLAKWKNPVFLLTEASIPSIPLEPSTTPHDCHRLQEPFTTATSQRLGKLTKRGLENAEVIAQVDKKYILLKMHGSTSSSEDAEMLVIVDQHAADERIRVERLFRELCEGTIEDDAPDPTQSVKKALTFSISPRDAQLLRRFRGEFLRWGIGYEVSGATVEVTTLPRVARDRCENEPVLAIELLRKYAYELEERGVRPPLVAEEEEEGGEDWVRQLARIPAPLKEMVNSRACRGAIMFNDPLTIEQCKALVQRLAKCRWPFMCAHGRVSMRPLVELGSGAGDGGVRAREQKGGFRDAYAQWKKKDDG